MPVSSGTCADDESSETQPRGQCRGCIEQCMRDDVRMLRDSIWRNRVRHQDTRRRGHRRLDMKQSCTTNNMETQRGTPEMMAMETLGQPDFCKAVIPSTTNCIPLSCFAFDARSGASSPSWWTYDREQRYRDFGTQTSYLEMRSLSYVSARQIQLRDPDGDVDMEPTSGGQALAGHQDSGRHDVRRTAEKTDMQSEQYVNTGPRGDSKTPEMNEVTGLDGFSTAEIAKDCSIRDVCQ